VSDVPDELLVSALLALAAGNAALALRHCEEACEEACGQVPDALAHALRDHLAKVSSGGVYEDPTAFQAFIDNGTNPQLYDATIAALSAVHQRVEPVSVLDIGCGDGRVTNASLGASARFVTLVEPSVEMCDQAAHLLRAAGHTGQRNTRVEVEARNCGIETYLATEPSAPHRFDLVQSTFALHNLAPAERQVVLRNLAARCQHIAIVEFDVPAFSDHSREHCKYVIDRYRAGIAEYQGHPQVIDGFLMPVLVAQFDPTKVRHTYEQSTNAWVAELETAGFSDITTEMIFPYWWAPARIISASR
jgi:SAM-dependent methyltransferase